MAQELNNGKESAMSWMETRYLAEGMARKNECGVLWSTEDREKGGKK